MLVQGAELLATWPGGLMLAAAVAVLWSLVRWRGPGGALGGAGLLVGMPLAVIPPAQGQAVWAGTAMLYLIPWVMAVAIAGGLVALLAWVGRPGGRHG